MSSGEVFKAGTKPFSVNMILIGIDGKDLRSSKSLRKTRWQPERRRCVQCRESVHPQEPMPISTVQTATAIKVVNKRPLFSPIVITREKHNQFLQSAEHAQLPLTFNINLKCWIPHRAVAKMYCSIFSFSHLSGQTAALLIQVLLEPQIFNVPQLVRHTRAWGSCDVHVGLAQWHSRLAIIWFKLCPVPGDVNGWGYGLFRQGQHMPPLV